MTPTTEADAPGPGALDWSGLEAVLFDLDGVLTDTAALHVRAWKEVFDDFLATWSKSGDRGPQPPFDPQGDYHRYVDGKPRYDGVRDFLASRGIQLPEGDPSVAPGDGSVQALGNRKNRRVNELFETEGVYAFPGSLAFLDAVEAAGLKTAVVTSSANGDTVLAAAGLGDRMPVRVDGKVAGELGLPGKPLPDTFLEAARRLGVPAARAVVVEDALAGVEAGRRGGFGAVVGVARGTPPEALRGAGASVVVSDLGELVASVPPPSGDGPAPGTRGRGDADR